MVSVIGRARRAGRVAVFALATASIMWASVVTAHAAITPLLPPPLFLEQNAVIRVDLPGVAGETYAVSYDTTSAFTAPQTLVTTGENVHIQGIDGTVYYVTYRVEDAAGVSGESPIAIATADGRAPVTTLMAVPAMPDGLNGWFVSPVEATMTASDDDGSGGIWKFVHRSNTCPCGEVEFDGSTGGLPSVYATRVVPVEGINECLFFAVDGAGNQEATNTARLMLDMTRPTVQVELSTESSAASRTSIMATVTASDGTSGVGRIEYAFLVRGSMPSSSTTWTSVPASMTTLVAPEGAGTLFVRAFDVAGNVSETATADVWFDATAPVTSFNTSPASPDGLSGTWKTAPAVTFQVTDVDTMTTTMFAWDSVDTSSFVTGTSTRVPAVDGTHTLRYLSVDQAGNRESTRSATFVLNQAQATSFTITATAGANGTITPSGSQTLTAGAGATYTITPNAGYRIASVMVDGVSVGTGTTHVFSNVMADHIISATFVRIAKLPTRCTIRVSATSIRSGRFVTLTARLTGGTFAPGTRIRFEVLRRGTTRYVLLKTVAVDSSGVATMRYRVVARGNRYHRVRFMGDSTFSSSPIVRGTRLRVF